MQALPHNVKTTVWLYEDAAPRESGMIKGRFEWATADSITLRSSDAGNHVDKRRNGRAVTIPKDHIRMVSGKIRFRNAARNGAIAGFAVMAGLTLAGEDFAQPYAALIFGGGRRRDWCSHWPCSPSWDGEFCCLSSREPGP